MSLRPHVAPELLTKVSKFLGITALDQWYYISQHAATKAIGTRTLNKFGGTLAHFLKSAYPEHQFDEGKLKSKTTQEKDQKFVEVIIRQLFPNVEILTKARKAVGIVNPETDAYLEIDFWIPSLKLGIEYQDKHHYGYQWYAHGALGDYQKRDDIKKATMSKLGYTLITIGFWWDKTIESVAATIREVRPDLLQRYQHSIVAPIPTEPPPGYIAASPVIPGAAGIMSPFIPGSNFDPTNWYAGEKHDGIRGVFNPNLRKIFSRSGNELSVLPALLKDVPSILIDGEIVAGRGNYTKTAAVSYHTPQDKVNWPMIRFMVFDIPDVEAGNYTQRYSFVTRGLMAHSYTFSQLAFRVLLKSKAHLKSLVATILADAGEGAIAQQDSNYEYGRAKGLAKIKVRRDADAKVLRINNASCTCKLVSGATGDIPFTSDFDPSDLHVGDIVSYYHKGYSETGLPKHAEIYKVRFDVSWEELLSDNSHNTVKRRSVKEAFGSTSLIERDTVRNKMGHWNKPTNVRTFFDKFAQTVGFNALVPDNWYPVRVRALLNAGGGSLLTAFNNTVRKALGIAYPELKFDAKKFRSHDKPKATNKWRHWNKPSNVRAFFEQFARAEGFDPIVPDNWYRVRVGALRNAGGGGLLQAFNNNLETALSCAYPDLNFEKENFETHAIRGRWNKSAGVRAFFNEFARTAGFDPLVPENWNAVRHSTVQKAKGGSGLLQAYDFNIKKALSSAYPELSFGKET